MKLLPCPRAMLTCESRPTRPQRPSNSSPSSSLPPPPQLLLRQPLPRTPPHLPRHTNHAVLSPPKPPANPRHHRPPERHRRGISRTRPTRTFLFNANPARLRIRQRDDCYHPILINAAGRRGTRGALSPSISGFRQVQQPHLPPGEGGGGKGRGISYGKVTPKCPRYLPAEEEAGKKHNMQVGRL